MPPPADLYVPTRADLSAAAARQDAVRFEGVAVGTRVYTAQDGSRIAITPEHLPLIAERIQGVQVRDLHDECVRATVGAVREARVEGRDVRFEGKVALQPHRAVHHDRPDHVRHHHLRYTTGDGWAGSRVAIPAGRAVHHRDAAADVAVEPRGW